MKTTSCEHMKEQWGRLVENLSLLFDLENENDYVTVRLDHYEKIAVKIRLEKKRNTYNRFLLMQTYVFL